MAEPQELTHNFAHLSEMTMHYVMAGSGDAVVLLHGWPQTWYEWRHIIPRLAARYHVIAPDLRGLGDSSRPLAGYDKMTIGRDVLELLQDHLGLERYAVVGHDWGGPVAFALTAQRPEAVGALAILDVVVPGTGADIAQGGKRWHHGFHRTPDLPEALVQGRERAYLSWFYRTFSDRPDAIGPADIEEYLRTYSQPGALRAGFNYYRATPQDAADNRALLEGGFRLTMPVLAIGGAKAEARGRGAEPEESLRAIADDVTGRIAEHSGHFLVEEEPEFVASELLALLERCR
ncbi:MAG: alpha/beta fold hydrolase [Methyloligellaceae bacterium]